MINHGAESYRMRLGERDGRNGHGLILVQALIRAPPTSTRWFLRISDRAFGAVTAQYTQ